MDKQRRKELLEEYKKIKTFMGIVQVKNKTNGKIYIEGCSNLKNRWFSIKNQLMASRHPNALLQADWNEMGENAFEYKVLEQKATDDISDVNWELHLMEKAWLEKLQPYGEKGYLKPKPKTN